MVLQDALTLGVSLAFWYQKKMNVEVTSPKMEKQVEEQHHVGTKIDSRKIVLYINIGVLIFYVVAVYWSFKAYKEFKGVVEDHVGYEALKNNDE